MPDELFSERLFLKRRLRAEVLKMQERLGLLSGHKRGVHWLIIATLPNAGSTALAQLLLSGKSTAVIDPNGEGQWQTFDMHQPSRRWNPEARIDYRAMRVLWLDRLKQQFPDRPVLVVEKSPPNLVRMERVIGALDAMPVRLMRLTRDPYAVCASWSERYGTERIARDWAAATSDMEPASPAFFKAIGSIYGERFARLVALAPRSGFDIRYEDLTADPVSSLAPLKAGEPLLADIDVGAPLQVKDYEPRPLENMNERQIGNLAPAQIDAISAGLAPFADDLHTFGYELR